MEAIRPFDVPVALLVSTQFVPQVWAGRPCEPAACHAHWLRLRLAALSRLAPKKNQTSMTLTETDHDIQRDEPSLVVGAIRRVAAASKAR